MSNKSKKEDMTRIEDLSEFLHNENSELDNLFDETPPPFNEDVEIDILPEQSEDEEIEGVDFGTDSSFDLLEIESTGDLTDSSDTDFTFPETEDEDENQDFLLDQEDEDIDSFSEIEDIKAVEEIENIEDLPDYEEEIPQEVSSTFFLPPLEETEEEEQSKEIITPATRENFKDVQDFGNSISYGKVQSGGTPAFSIMLKGIEKENFDSILAILNEYDLVGNNESIIRQSLELEVLLIAQISEFSAIFLANKLKQYSTDISIGLSEQIHKSKSYDKDNKGLVTKKNIFQNKDKKYIRENQKFNLEDLIVTKNGQIPNTTISEHFGVIATSKIVSLADLTRQDLSYTDNLKNSKLEINSLAIYDDLIKELSILAFEKGANAVLSVTHSMSSITEKNEDSEIQYQIICSGDAVVVDKI